MFWAQENNPVKNDWVNQVKEDLKTFELEYLSFNNIKHMKKEQFKGLVKMKCKKVAFTELTKEKETKSKIKHIQYKSLQIQPYLVSNKINLRRKKLIFKIRTRMIATADNFGQSVPCKICHLQEDSIPHVIDCILLKLEVPEILTYRDIGPSDIFSEDMEKVSTFAFVFEKAWRKREQIIAKE